jgi:hypothetical protein
MPRPSDKNNFHYQHGIGYISCVMDIIFLPQIQLIIVSLTVSFLGYDVVQTRDLRGIISQNTESSSALL